MMFLLRKVHVLVPLYFVVNVLLPAVRPVTREVALNLMAELPAPSNAVASEAASVVAPLTAKPIKHWVPPFWPLSVAVTVTSAFPEDEMVAVCDGPAVVRSV